MRYLVALTYPVPITTPWAVDAELKTLREGLAVLLDAADRPTTIGPVVIATSSHDARLAISAEVDAGEDVAAFVALKDHVAGVLRGAGLGVGQQPERGEVDHLGASPVPTAGAPA